MNINKSFSGQYIKSSEIDHDTILTIRKVALESVGQGDDQEEKPIVFFSEIDRGLVLNKTNAGTIAGLYGAETDDWIGKQITLYSTEVSFQGKQMLGLRVRMTKPTTQKQPATSAPAKDELKQARDDISRYAADLKAMSKQARDAGDAAQADEWDEAIRAARVAYGNIASTAADLVSMASALQIMAHPVPVNDDNGMPF